MTTELAGIIPNLAEDIYHAHPSLSSTGARRILDSPARFRYMADHPQPPKREFDLGSAIHSKTLGTGYEVVIIPGNLLAMNGAVSTKAAKEFADKARAKGQIPVVQKTIDHVDAVAESVLAHPVARALLEQEGISEASVFSTDPMTGVATRCRFDHLPTRTDRRTVAVDLKSAGNERGASRGSFAKTVAQHGYDVQHGFYGDTYGEATGDWDMELVFVVVETEAPYLVSVHQLDRDFVEIGAAKARRAREVFRQCTENDSWPGYPPEIQLLAPPMFHIYDYQENYS